MQANKEKRTVIFKRAEKYVKEYRDAEREKVRLTRVAKADNSAYIPAEATLIFVVRIKGYVENQVTLRLFADSHQYQQDCPQAA